MHVSINSPIGSNFNLNSNPGNYTKIGYGDNFKKIYYRIESSAPHSILARVQKLVVLLLEAISSFGGSLNNSDTLSQWREVFWNQKEIVIISNENLLKVNFPDHASKDEMVAFMRASFSQSSSISDTPRQGDEDESKKTTNYTKKIETLGKKLECEIDFSVPFHKFMGKLEEIVSSKADRETSNAYNQFYTDLCKLNCHAKKELVSEAIQKLIFDDSQVSREMVYYAAYRLWNELALDKMQQFIELKDHWNVLKVSGDGNCMLWACLISKKIEESDNPSAAYEQYKNFGELGQDLPDYKKLYDEMVTLRSCMAAKFEELINNPDNESFRIQFVLYITNAATFEKAKSGLKDEKLIDIIEDEDCDQLMVSGVPTENMIRKFSEYLKTPKKYNGEFEAQIIAKILEVPIVILRGRTNEKMPLGTIAGIEFIGQHDKNPIILRNSGVHYDSLL